VFGRRFDPLGLALGVELQISLHTIDIQGSGRIDIDADGDFVVVWEGVGQDGDGYGVFVQRFDSLGLRVGDQRQVNSFFTGDQFRASVALEAAGDFTVVWVSEDGDGESDGVFGRHYAVSGAAGPQFLVNSYTTGSQYEPEIGVEDGGEFVAVWSSQDGGGAGIFGQRFIALAPLDVDGNGSTDPLTDGLLVLRYEFGFSGATLITGAVGPGCARCTAPQIEAYLAGMV
jgi:hypothetical protein